MRARVYVAGPMTLGDYTANIRAGIDAGERLLSLGFAPYVPHLDSFWGLCYTGRTLEEWLELDFAWLRACDAVLRLPGASKGADLEVAHAQGAKIPVFNSIDELDKYFHGRKRGAV